MPTREEMRSLAEEIVRCYEDRIAGIAQIRDTATQLRETVRTDLKEFRDSRTAMGWELRADLARSVADRKSAVSTELKELNRTLEELNSTRGAMSTRLKADLARGVADRKGDVGAMRKGFDAELKEVRTVLAGGRDEWQKLTATMQAKIGVLVVEVKPPKAIAPV
jgi:chaperonin cofactor prefoldin